MGMVPSQVVGKVLHRFLPQEIADEKKQYYARAWAGEENFTYEAEIKGIIYLAQLRPIRKNGRVVEVIGSCVDLTQRKKAERGVQDSEAKYRLIADNMTDLISFSMFMVLFIMLRLLIRWC